MFASYEVLTTFGISAILSFVLTMVILLAALAKRGYFRIGSKSTIGKGSMTDLSAGKSAQIGSPLLVTPTAPPLPMIVELAPLKECA